MAAVKKSQGKGAAVKKSQKSKAAGEKTIGRPLKDIDEEQVRELAKIQCSYAEMAAVLRCNESTLTRRFAQVIREGREAGKSSLKRWQWKRAEAGSDRMLMWLGKQHLGQADKVETKDVTQAGRTAMLEMFNRMEDGERREFIMKVLSSGHKRDQGSDQRPMAKPGNGGGGQADSDRSLF